MKNENQVTFGVLWYPLATFCHPWAGAKAEGSGKSEARRALCKDGVLTKAAPGFPRFSALA
jgi:hypothetical protein